MHKKSKKSEFGIREQRKGESAEKNLVLGSSRIIKSMVVVQ
jgi:hypothetical protein